MSTRIKKQKALGCVAKSRYDVMVAKLKGDFKIPVGQRTPEQKTVLNLIRKRNDFQLDNEGRLLCHGKTVIIEEELPALVKNHFKQNRGCGPRVLYNKLKENYTGFSERNIIEILSRSEFFHRQYPRFLNKPLPKTVTAQEPGQRWQIDIVSMNNFEESYQNKTFKYILQIIDIYSRYIMPQPLERKTSKDVAIALEKEVLQNGAPDIIQCDNGTEFKGRDVRRFLYKYDIKVIHGRPYHPQSEGKCERSNQELRKRIRFACTRKNGFNWVVGLPGIAHEMNTSVKRVLGNLTSFQAYHGKALKIKDMKKRIEKASNSFRTKMMRTARMPSKYEVGERVLLRYPFCRTRAPTRRYILSGLIVRVNKDGSRYLVVFKNPKQQHRERHVHRQWTGVENITSITIKKEKEKQNKAHNDSSKLKESKSITKQHRERYYHVLSHDDKLHKLQHGVSVLFDPNPDGNCQFAALSHQLNLIGIHRDARTLRQEAVGHLRSNRKFYEDFVHDVDFDDYLKAMEKDGTYGDNLTLVSIIREYNMQCMVESSKGPECSALVSNDGVYDHNLHLITLGHFQEESGMHYLSIAVDQRLVDELILRESETCDNSAIDENTYTDSDHLSASDVESMETDSAVEMLRKMVKSKM